MNQWSMLSYESRVMGKPMSLGWQFLIRENLQRLKKEIGQAEKQELCTHWATYSESTQPLSKVAKSV